jgi:dienelactone hydrolase
MIHTCCVVVCALALPAGSPAEELRVLPAKIDGMAPPATMKAYWMRQVDEAVSRRAAEFEKLVRAGTPRPPKPAGAKPQAATKKGPAAGAEQTGDHNTAEVWASYQERMRKLFTAQLGGFPARTPLEPQVVGRLQRDGYTVEKVIFQSQPRHYVTALFYLPQGKPPLPGVLVPCGHSDNGKAMDTYQRACILLVKNGLAVLCYDPIDQGERFQLLDKQGKPQARGTVAHCLAGVGSILLGRNTATFRIWDGMRSLDYLAGRPEVDPKRLGCTGNSGGGTLTSYLMALDERILAAAPSCYLTSLGRLLHTIGPQDAEQNIFGQVALGLDHADYVLMRAPRPTLLCTATRDFFDISGAWDTFRQAKRCYTALGFAERVDLIETEAEHGFSIPLRTAAARWMRRWLQGIDDTITESPWPVLTDKEALCTPDGQVMRLPGARSVYDINRDFEAQLAAKRKGLWKNSGPQKMLDEVRRLTGIRRLGALAEPTCEKVGSIARPGFRIDKLVLRPEPGIWLPALAFVPETACGEATLYLHASGKQADAGPGGPIEKLVGQGQVVLAVDLRGLGETQTIEKSGYSSFLGPEWRETFMAYMLGKSYLAGRAEDTLVCARFLAGYAKGEKPHRVHLAAIGLAGPPALHAAALEPQLFASVTLKRSLKSWSDVVRTSLAKNQLVNVVHGALAVYDLPDLLATLPKGEVAVVEPAGAEHP